MFSNVHKFLIYFHAVLCRLWNESGMEVAPSLCNLLINDVIHEEAVVREAAAEALADAVEQHRECAETALQAVYDTYTDKLTVSMEVHHCTMSNVG